MTLASTDISKTFHGMVGTNYVEHGDAIYVPKETDGAMTMKKAMFLKVEKETCS